MFVIGRVEGLFNIYTSLGCAIGTMHTAEKLAEHAATCGGRYENSVDLSRNGKRRGGGRRKGERMLRLTRRWIYIYIYVHSICIREFLECKYIYVRYTVGLEWKIIFIDRYVCTRVRVKIKVSRRRRSCSEKIDQIYDIFSLINSIYELIGIRID